MDTKANNEAVKAQFDEERRLWKERIDNERELVNLAHERVALTEKERDLNIEKFTFYKTAYEACQQAGKHGIGCFFKHLFTLWMARCK